MYDDNSSYSCTCLWKPVTDCLFSYAAPLLLHRVSRLWKFKDRNKYLHTLQLNHDTLLGMTALELDNSEVSDSIGGSNCINLLFRPARLPFFLPSSGQSGVLEIKKKGIFGYTYRVFFDGEEVQPTTSLEKDPGVNVELSITGYVLLPSIKREKEKVVWYEIYVKRKSDGCNTRVYRRYSDFVSHHEAVSNSLKVVSILSDELERLELYFLMLFQLSGPPLGWEPANPS